MIETHVMATINEGFGHLFQKWFNLLVDSPDIIVEVDQCFACGASEWAHDGG